MKSRTYFAFSAGLAPTGNWHVAILSFPAGLAPGRGRPARPVCGGGASGAWEDPPPGCGNPVGGKPDPYWDTIRQAMGQTLRYATRMDLARMVPRGDLASSGFCLADPGREYLVYLPKGGEALVDLSGSGGELAVEWMDAAQGTAGALPASVCEAF